MPTDRKIAVIGLGYVGLPVATTFAKYGVNVLGFDINQKRVEELKSGIDLTEEVESHDLKSNTLAFSTDPTSLKDSDFYIVTVPTPINDVNQPDLGALIASSETVGAALKKGDVVVYESTVYPGATEEDCIPVLEEASGLKAGKDFKVGYSPERINPGDKKHRFDTILKIVSGQDEEALRIISETYGSVVKAGIHEAPTIKTAEAAKVIENTQRDINIALINELALIFDRLNIDTNDVLAAAGTKWNFLKFAPGLVGGHCIGVDPYYLTYRAEKAGYHPEMILAGRRINNRIARWIAHTIIKKVIQRGIKGQIKVGVLGVTFKEDVPDIRNTKVTDIIDELKKFGADVVVSDPVASKEEVSREFDLTLSEETALLDLDVLVIAVPHKKYIERGWELAKQYLPHGGIIFDVKGILDRNSIPNNIDLIRL